MVSYEKKWQRSRPDIDADFRILPYMTAWCGRGHFDQQIRLRKDDRIASNGTGSIVLSALLVTSHECFEQMILDHSKFMRSLAKPSCSRWTLWSAPKGRSNVGNSDERQTRNLSTRSHDCLHTIMTAFLLWPNRALSLLSKQTTATHVFYWKTRRRGRLWLD